MEGRNNPRMPFPTSFIPDNQRLALSNQPRGQDSRRAGDSCCHTQDTMLQRSIKQCPHIFGYNQFTHAAYATIEYHHLTSTIRLLVHVLPSDHSVVPAPSTCSSRSSTSTVMRPLAKKVELTCTVFSPCCKEIAPFIPPSLKKKLRVEVSDRRDAVREWESRSDVGVTLN